MFVWIFQVVLSLMVAMQATASPAPKAGARPPNFVFIQAEAQGWSSTSVDMDGTPPSTAKPAGLTPNLEAMAKDGMRFTDFYVSCPRCTPSRASWVTGISPAKLHMTYQNEGGASRRDAEGGDAKSRYKLMRMIPPTVEPDLPAGVKTTGGMLHDLGYGTAHFGKWHAGRQKPSDVGFDLCDGANSNQGPERGQAPNPKQASAITDKGIAFMREQVKKGKPFFVQISHYGFGSEEEATPEALEATRRLVTGVSGKPLGAIAGARDVDTQVGRVMAALKEMGVADNTWIFYSADHGAQGGGGGGGRNQSNPPFTGGKGSVSEGGIRVPFIVHGPGVKAGSVSHVRATGMDLLPTLMDLAGKPLPKAERPDEQTVVEGGSLVPVLEAGGEGAVTRSHEEIVIHFPHYDLNNGGPASALYLGDWKLVRNYDSGKTMLYDIAKDPGEKRDLAAEQFDRVKDMTRRLDDYLKAVKAQMPEKNTDPEAGKGDPHDTPPLDDARGGGKSGGGKGGGGKGGGGKGGGGKGGNGGGNAN
jgi:arylsulfatase A-like enzyme